jgi:hypothetical protein
MMLHGLLFFAAVFCLGMDHSSRQGSQSVEQELLAHEKEIWEAYRNKDLAALQRLLADDFLEVADPGKRFTKAQILAAAPDITVTEYSIQEVKVVPFATDSAIISYKRRMKGNVKGHTFPPEAALAAGTWTRRDGRWQQVLYQETIIRR